MIALLLVLGALFLGVGWAAAWLTCLLIELEQRGWLLDHERPWSRQWARVSIACLPIGGVLLAVYWRL